MPVEIDQLIINARVVAEDDSDSSGDGQAGSSGDAHSNDLVERCVSEVLRVLNDRGER